MTKNKDINSFVTKSIHKKELNESKNQKLAIKIRTGEKARSDLIELNIILIKLMIDSFHEKDDERNDLLKAGYIGLCKSIDVYNQINGSFVDHAKKYISDHMNLRLYERNKLIDDSDKKVELKTFLEIINNGTYHKTIMSSVHEDRNQKLIAKIQKGEQARNELIENNMILVKNLVDNFCKDDNQYSDMLQAGYIGLLKAVEKYNQKEGAFIPYAMNWINKYIRLSLYEMSKLIEMPEEMSRISMVVNAVRNRIYGDIGRSPTYDEIYEHPDIQKLVRQGKLKKSNIEPLLKLSSHDSLDVPVSNEYDINHIDILIDNNQINIEEELSSEDLIRECLRTLNDNAKKVVTMYLGLDGNGCHSFQQISDVIGLKKQRCSGIYAESIEKLRKRFQDSDMYDFWERL